MAAHGWRSHRSLKTQVVEEFSGFDYYQLVRLASRLAHAERRNGAAPPLRFQGDVSAAFAGFEISALSRDPASGAIALRSPNFSLAGNAGPLPEPFSEWVRVRLREGQRALADFLDLFNHRLHLLRWRIKSRLHPGLHDDDPDRCDYADYLGAVIGLMDPGLVRQLPIPRRSLLGLAGLLADNRRSAAALTQSLTLLLGAEVSLDPLVGRWLTLDAGERSLLGRQHSRLGRDSALGARCFDPQAAIRLRVAPLPFEKVCMLMPNGRDHSILRELLRLLTDRQVDVFMEMAVMPETAPPPRLAGGTDPDTCGPRISRTARLASRDDGGLQYVRFLVTAYDENERSAAA